jgi:hypothetical protein
VSQDNRYCSSCGAQLSPGAAYCSRCGTPVSGAPTSGAPPPATPPSGRYRRDYRYEKYEKQEKREKQEKGRGGNIAGPIVGGLILIWLGATFYLQEIGFIPTTTWWAYFLAGIGGILILQGLINFGVSRRPFIGSFIGGAILLLIGLFFIANIQNIFWPLILVVIGVAILASSFTARRRTPPP